MPKLIVLRPFTFTHPADEHTRISVETRFFPGVHEVAESVIDHPWIKAGADGRIETAAQSKARSEREIETKRIQDEANAEATANAEAAVGRMAAADSTARGVSKEAIEKELNTPVSELRKKGPGAGVTGGR